MRAPAVQRTHASLAGDWWRCLNVHAALLASSTSHAASTINFAIVVLVEMFNVLAGLHARAGCVAHGYVACLRLVAVSFCSRCAASSQHIARCLYDERCNCFFF
jgi:hypothetical protein